MSGNTANPGYTGTTMQGNGLVSGPSDASLYYLTYNEINDIGKTWIKKYAQADAKELLGIGIRGKFSGVLPIPGKDITLNSESLITNGRADMEKLKTELGEMLGKLNYKAILENNTAIHNSIVETFKHVPMGIFLG